MAGIKYEIKENCGVISTSSKGWSKELNMVSWNDKAPKFDLREWDPEHTKMGKGVTLTREELIELKDILNNMQL